MEELKEKNHLRFLKMFSDAEVKETRDCFYKWVNENNRLKTIIYWKSNGRISKRREHERPFIVITKD